MADTDSWLSFERPCFRVVDQVVVMVVTAAMLY
jgi:hypothetical protein